MTAMVTMDNYEEYLLLHADGELSGEEEKALQAFMTQHPELQREMELYAATKLSPDMQMVYEGKETLLKKEAAVIPFYASWRTYGAAAGIAAIIALVIWKNNGPVVTTDNNIVQAKQDRINIAAPKDTLTQKTQEEVAIAKALPETKTNIEKPKAAVKQEHQYATSKPKTAMPDMILASADIKPLATEGVMPANAAEVTYTMPVYKPKPEEIKAEPRFSFFRRKKQSISNISEAVDDKLNKVRKLTDDVSNTDVVLRLGKKELLIVKL